MKTIIAEIRPEIEFPQRGETIISPKYAFRVGVAGAADRVDLSIDHGRWLPCRNAAGYWWYEWSGYDDGRHTVKARARGRDGRWLVSLPHDFLVAATA